MVSLAFNSSSPSQARFVSEPRPTPAARLRSGLVAFVTEWNLRRTVRSVEALDSHMLADIGLTAGGIEDAVRHGR